jgi:hypothetical protein
MIDEVDSDAGDCLNRRLVCRSPLLSPGKLLWIPAVAQKEAVTGCVV